MKFWKKIFCYSIILFIILFNGAGIILIEKIHRNNVDNIIKSAIDQHDSIITTLYLNMDKKSIESEEYFSQWIEVTLMEYIASENTGLTNLEVYSSKNEPIISKSKLSISGDRKEIIEAKTNEKTFLIRNINNKKILFVSSLVKIQDQNIKLVLSKDIDYIYMDKINNYEFFFLLDLITIVILATCMYIISKNVTKPIVELTKASIDISDGDYTKRVYVNNKNDEVGVLSKNFNIMVDVVEKNIKDLNDINNSKQRFIDSLTHEIKTPITSIIGYSDLLLRGKVKEEIQNKALVYINSEARRLEGLNNTLLKLILIREENINLSILEIKDVVDKSIEALSYKLQNKNLSLDLSIENGKVYGDKQLIIVLLSNIIDNAIKASNNSSKIVINGMCKSNLYTLSIKDFGIGMLKEDIDKIAEPFYMADKSRNSKNSSIGLGLSICNEICSIHNIKLEVKSELNIGTEVILEFSEESKKL